MRLLDRPISISYLAEKTNPWMGQVRHGAVTPDTQAIIGFDEDDRHYINPLMIGTDNVFYLGLPPDSTNRADYAKVEAMLKKVRPYIKSQGRHAAHVLSRGTSHTLRAAP